ncbi:MAG: Crp/Fnr family transcriptional regulator [Amphritea sp.]|nr:Crp/Fnr family transcriptional regulator [Amphritea sp.]
MSFLTNPIRNMLIESLSISVRDKLLNRCSLIDWTFGEIVYEPYQVYENVYFPLSGFISLLTGVHDHQLLEMGLIGNEGMLGVNQVLGVNHVSMQSLVQGTGQALALPVDQFQRSLLDCPGLSSVLTRYTYVLMQQLAQAGVCLHFHDIEARMARWLLMTQDRSHGDRLYLTHAFLARMLGVRRSSVSIAAEALQEKHLIKYTRGNICILDRKGLEAASCECYQEMNKCYDKILNNSKSG